jgi:plastocyanin
MKRLIFLVAVLVLSSMVLANLEGEIEELSQNFVGQELPESLGKLFGNEIINIHLDKEDGGQLITGLVIADNVVESLQLGTIESPSLNVYSSEGVLNDIKTSSNPLAEARNALESGEISYQAVGFFNKIKFGLVGMLTSFADVFIDLDVPENSEANGVTGNLVSIIANEISQKEIELTPEDIKGVEELVQEIIEDTGPKTHIVKLTNLGFSEEEIKIKVGDTVSWENIREGRVKKGLVIGAKQCRAVKSKVFGPEESFDWVFEKAETCLIVDGIYTTKTMNIIIEE